MKLQFQDQINAFFEKNRENMLRDLEELVKIPSIHDDPRPGMPFGPGPAKALAKAASLLEREGLIVTNYKNAVLSGDLSTLEPGLDILCHLDVVPADGTWTVCDPFQPLFRDNRLYGRGTSDNKGPCIAALYALSCFKTLNIPLKRNVRLILGTDEECGFGATDLAVYYYTENEEAPMSFTPDSSFPLINVEKGRFNGEIEATFRAECQLPCIMHVKSGTKLNVIPETATAVVLGFEKENLAAYLTHAAERTETSFSQQTDDGRITITCRGKSGHAAYPEKANNALTALLSLLKDLPCADTDSFRKIKALSALFPHGDYYGKALGVNLEDQISGCTTISADILSIDKNGLYLGFDGRCAACANEENTYHAARDTIEKHGLSLRETKMLPSHYVPADTPFVETLLDCYELWSREKGTPGFTGGSTYVHALKNGVGFGCKDKQINNRIHGEDEFIIVDQLILSGKIFVQTILELCC